MFLINLEVYRLSALIETADEQFELLKNEREEYITSLVSEKDRESGRFNIEQVINLDNFQAFLDFYFPDRSKSLEDTRNLLDEIKKFDIDLSKIRDSYEIIKPYLPKIEAEEFGGDDKPHWAQAGIMRTILDIAFDNYWESRYAEMPSPFLDTSLKWRNNLRKKKIIK